MGRLLTESGLSALTPAWDLLNQNVDEDLHSDHAEFADEIPTRDDEAEIVDEINQGEVAARQRQLKRLTALSTRLNIQPVESILDLVTLMQTIGLLDLTELGELSLAGRIPLPGEVFDLTPEEQTAEDAWRWRRLHEPAAIRILHLFRPCSAGRVDSLTFTMVGLGQQLGIPTEAIREGIRVLLDDGDFTTEHSLDDYADDVAIRLCADWKKFADNRMTFRLEDDGPA
jgi:hypothetical protein